MKYRHLGKTGITVSEIGFGTWGLGGNSYGPVDDAVSTRALQCAYDQGITFYDTSDLYGNGHSEAVLGAAMRPVRQDIVICSKVGLLPHSGFEMPCDFSPKYIRNGLEASLKRLDTDYIDLYLLHSPVMAELHQNEMILSTLAGLQDSGKIRFYGISARTPADALDAIKSFNIAAVQVNFNLIDQRARENGLLTMAQEKGVGVIARTPLCFGYLTGTMNGTESFQGIDHRANWPAQQRQRWAAAPNIFSFLNEDKTRTPSQLALRYCIDQPGITTVIPGMMNAREVEENVTTVELEPLCDSELDRIQLVYKAHEFYDRTAKQGR